MTRHPLFDRILRKAGASLETLPSLEAWQAVAGLVARTYRDADQDRYTIERAMEMSSLEMQELYEELRQRTAAEIKLLRDSDERHRLLFNSNPLPMWVIDAETLRFVDVNVAMTVTYGYSRDEFLAMRAMDVKLPGDVPEMLRAIEASTSTIEHLGLRKHRCKNGTILELDITVHEIVMDGRRCVLGIALDMTRARRVDEELRQAQKMEAVGRLAGGVAHDFNNILAAILANAEYLLGDLGEPPTENGEILGEIRDAAERAAGLTRQLLTFSRKQQRQTKPLALNAVVTGIEAMLNRIVGEDITMSATIASDLGTIEADPGEVEQVLMNLVVNARDAMPEGGRILLETANQHVDEMHALEIGVAAGRYVVLSVTDTGCGMTEDIRVRIFEPFFTTKDVDKGTGLGLATVFGIMKESRGGISVYSEPGRGTTFRMYWPRIDAAVTKDPPRCFVPVRGAGTILVVEDDQQLRNILRRYLTSWGYTLLEAPSGTAALELLHQHGGPIDLLLTDLVMPGGLDGRSLSRYVVAEQPRAKVVFMSGYTEHPAIKSAALRPDDYFVQKPFSAQVLCETLQRALSDRAATGGRVE